MPDLAISPSVLHAFRDTVREVTGIQLPASKEPMIHQRLRRLVLAGGWDSTDAFLSAALRSQDMSEDLFAAIDLLTTNTTAFFREPSHFEFLRRQILPDRLRQRARPPRLKIWSAASSEGAEAYTVAMVLADAQREGHAFDYAILGTDISHRMLEKARSAIYHDTQLTGIPPQYLSRYLLTSRDPGMEGQNRIVPELRARVRFAELNLMRNGYPVDRDVDVVFLRNVLIYFDAEDQARVVSNITQHLAPGGHLIVGHAESMCVRHPALTQIVPTIFVKR